MPPQDQLKRRIFRKGQDIFNIEGDTARRIPLPEFQEKFASPGFGAVEDLGQREDLFNQFFPAPDKSLPLDAPQSIPIDAPTEMPATPGFAEGIADTGDDVVDGDLGIRRDREEADASARDVLTGIDDLQNQIDTAPPDDFRDELTELEEAREEVRQARVDLTKDFFGEEEADKISEATRRARDLFAPLIREAEEAKAEGLSTGLIRAGEKGGLVSSQFVGLAALEPIAGESFFGIGGRLEKIKSTYDNAIFKLKAAQQTAMQQARNMAEAAVRTGRQDVLQNAIARFEEAQQFFEEQEALNTQKLDDLKTIEEIRKLRTESQAKTLDTMQKIPAGSTVFLPDGTELTGIGVENIGGFFKSADITKLMLAIPQGEEITLTDPQTGTEYTLQGLESPDPSTSKIVQSTDAQGNVIFTTLDAQTGQITNQVSAGTIGKPSVLGQPKQSQFIAATFAERTQASNSIIESLEEQFIKLDPVKFKIQQNLPNIAKSEDLRKLEQAQRDFVNAVLRRESGAAIAESEFKSAELQYFPQPGDSQAIIDQKRANRNIVINGLIREAGQVFEGGGVTPDVPEFNTLDDFVEQHPDKIENIVDLINQNPELTDDDILDILRGSPSAFSPVGSDTDNALVGNRPQRNKNPINVKSGGIADQFALKDAQGNPKTDEQGHLIFASADAGFQGARADLRAKVEGRSRFLPANPTLAELGSVFAEDPNWANSVASILGISTNTKTQDIDFNNLLNAIAQQEGFFA